MILFALRREKPASNETRFGIGLKVIDTFRGKENTVFVAAFPVLYTERLVMKRISTLTLLITALLFVVVAVPATDALAQQKQKLSFKVAAENAKYPQRHTIDVGDQAGHTVGIFEIHRTFPGNAPVINGVKLKEQWSRGFADYVNNSGLSTNYGVYVFENGDKFFTVTSNMGHADAAGKRTSMGVGQITGGTGKFVGMQGVIRSTGASDGKAGMNETQTEIEYWFAK